MFASLLAAIVDFSRRFAKPIAGLALIISILLAAYVVQNIAINTDINQLLSDNLPWRQREKAVEQAFPQKIDTLVIVIDGKSGDATEHTAAALAEKLQAMPKLFTMVTRPDALPFFQQNGLLYLSTKELGAALDQIAQSQPLLGTLVSDPSLRGFFNMLNLMLQGVQAGAADATQITAPMSALAEVIDATNSGKNKALDVEKLMPASSDQISARALRHFIIVKPVLDYSNLQPGKAATTAIRNAINELGLTADKGLQVRLTGSVPLNDEEFASVAEGAGLTTALSGILVLGLLFIAMRSWRIVLPIMLTLVAGLIASTAFATVAVGSLNLISVAFAVMFIGIAVDFGIQFGVRYRDQRHQSPDHATALRRTAMIIALPLGMAAGSTALGFLAFIPTDYRGVSELGLIAGVAMIIAFILNVTLLPALMTLTNPPAESEHIGFSFLKPVDAFMAKRRALLLPIITAVAISALIQAAHVRFDFDPLNLKNPNSESVSTMFDVMRDPDSDAYAAQMLTKGVQEAHQQAEILEKLPEVDHVMTLSSFVPEQQDKKLAMIADTTALLAPTLALPQQPPPSDEENLDAVRKMSAELHATPNMPAASQLADALDKLAEGDAVTKMKRVQDNLIMPLQMKMNDIQNVIQTKPVTLTDIPEELRRDWISADGHWLVEIFPKRGADNNPRDPAMLTRFIDAVQKIAPDVTGTPVSIRESGRTIVSAFIHAGIYGIVSIALLSFLVVRSLRDVGLMLTPLIIAGFLTLATIAVAGISLNFANIIALPLLLSLGVSYAVYFVFYAKSGEKNFLQSSMARAVLFSACTVLVAFGCLCFSTHPGTRGMGELLTIALYYSLICTFLILPILLGSHRPDKHHD